MTNWDKQVDNTTSYSKTADGITSYVAAEGTEKRYIPEGFGLKVASEDFTWMLTEDKLNRLVHSKMGYTQDTDVTTVYDKVLDA